jgi:hypothetical protein
MLAQRQMLMTNELLLQFTRESDDSSPMLLYLLL